MTHSIFPWLGLVALGLACTVSFLRKIILGSLCVAALIIMGAFYASYGAFGSIRIVFSALFSVVVVIGVVLTIQPAIAKNDSDLTVEEVRELSQANQIVLEQGADGALHPAFYLAIPLKEVPPHLRDALVATEDRRFFERSTSYDPEAWIRILLGGLSRGGSTIEAQLAKNAFLNASRTASRKITEAGIASLIETGFTKEEILQTYLSRIDLGSLTGGWHIVGAEQGARFFFGRHVEDLNLLQTAMLVGALKAPNRYNPTKSVVEAMNRARVVLNAMVSEGYINAEEADQALRTGLKPGNVKPLSPESRWFYDWIEKTVLTDMPDRKNSILHPGTRLYITQSLSAQTWAETALAKLPGAADGNQTALVSMNFDGQVVAAVGGRSYRENQFNRIMSKRQPGSAFKPFVYARALEAGYTTATHILDAPCEIDGWSPRNDDGLYLGVISLRTGLVRSRNPATACLAQKLGLRSISDLAHRMGIVSALQEVPSLALGTSPVSLLELTAAIGAYGNDGLGVSPYGLIAAVDSESGDVLYRRGTPNVQRVSDRKIAMDMQAMLSGVLTEGTAKSSNARVSSDAAGKTGTTQQSRDAWFVGFAGGRATGVWMGRDDGSPMGDGIVGATAARGWAAFNRGVLHDIRMPKATIPPVEAPRGPIVSPAPKAKPRKALSIAGR